MSDKIIAVMRKIISVPDHISDICQEDTEFYFKFGDHVFSVTKRSDDRFGEYSLYFYPKFNGFTEDLAEQYRYGSAEDINMLAYHESEYSVNEKSLFKELYTLIEERFLGADKAFDDILSSY